MVPRRRSRLLFICATTDAAWKPSILLVVSWYLVVTLTGVASGLQTLAKGVTPESGGRGRPCPRGRLRSNLSYSSAIIIIIIIIIKKTHPSPTWLLLNFVFSIIDVERKRRRQHPRTWRNWSGQVNLDQWNRQLRQAPLAWRCYEWSWINCPYSVKVKL